MSVRVVPPVRRIRRTVLAVVLAGLAVSAAGCGGGANAAAPSSAGSSSATDGKALAAFDSADSVASSKGDPAGLRTQETGAALDFSLAAANASHANSRAQAGYQHVQATYAAGEGCVLVSASLRLTGEEMLLPDFSEFTVRGSAWQLDNHVMLARSVLPGTTALTGQAAKPSNTVLAGGVRDALATELFARSIGGTPPPNARIGASTILDQQLAGGWQVYQQQLAGAKMTVSRTLNDSSWSPCAASTTGGTLTFVTFHLTDTVSALPGGPAQVSLPATSPDLRSVGATSAATGRQIVINRTESFLLQVPDSGSVSVLGLSDAATSVHTN